MVDPEDLERSVACNECGAPVAEGAGRAFEFGTENLLCAACATARGGRYDGARDAWVVAPDLAGLSDEAYGASPHEVRSRRT